MSLLAELNTIITNLGLPVETGVFSGVPPDEYVVLTPLTDGFSLFADNAPQCETQEVRVSIFSKGNYRQRAKQITAAMMAADITVTERRYVGYETDTKYHNYCVDTAREYELRED
jgi:hypothetical protein